MELGIEVAITTRNLEDCREVIRPDTHTQPTTAAFLATVTQIPYPVDKGMHTHLPMYKNTDIQEEAMATQRRQDCPATAQTDQ